MSQPQLKRRFFTQLEKDSLTFCVGKYKHILDNKYPNATYSNVYKKSVWMSVTEEYNAMPGVGKCTAKQLQDLYKNLKRRRQVNVEGEKVFVLKFENTVPETITGTGNVFLTETDSDVGVVLKQAPTPEDSKEFLKISALGEEKVNTSGHSDSSNPVQTPSGCTAINSVTTLENAAEPSTTASSTLVKSTDQEANTTTDKILPANELPTVSPTKPSTSGFRTKYLSLCRMRKSQSSAAKAANLLRNHQPVAQAQTEEEQDLSKLKLKAELDAQLNADRRAQEQHEMVLRNLRREERKMIREEKRARKDALRAEKLHDLKIRCLEAKIRYFESQMGGE